MIRVNRYQINKALMENQCYAHEHCSRCVSFGLLFCSVCPSACQNDAEAGIRLAAHKAYNVVVLHTQCINTNVSPFLVSWLPSVQATCRVYHRDVSGRTFAHRHLGIEVANWLPQPMTLY